MQPEQAAAPCGGLESRGSIRYRRGVGKKLSRSKRKELREQGLLEPPPPRVKGEEERTARRAEASPASAPERRVEGAKDDDEAERPASGTRTGRRDRTVLVLLALTAGAALIFWLTQRSPKQDTKMIDVPPPMGAPTGTAKP